MVFLTLERPGVYQWHVQCNTSSLCCIMYIMYYDNHIPFMYLLLYITMHPHQMFPSPPHTHNQHYGCYNLVQWYIKPFPTRSFTNQHNPLSLVPHFFNTPLPNKQPHHSPIQPTIPRYIKLLSILLLLLSKSFLSRWSWRGTSQCVRNILTVSRKCQTPFPTWPKYLLWVDFFHLHIIKKNLELPSCGSLSRAN